jgi:hypothetical protein
MIWIMLLLLLLIGNTYTQANATQTKHSHRTSRLYFGSPSSSSDTGRNATTKKTHLLQWCFVGDLGNRDLRKHRVLTEGRCALRIACVVLEHARSILSSDGSGQAYVCINHVVEQWFAREGLES